MTAARVIGLHLTDWVTEPPPYPPTPPLYPKRATPFPPASLLGAVMNDKKVSPVRARTLGAPNFCNYAAFTGWPALSVNYPVVVVLRQRSEGVK